jgi:hypothetical protein
MKRIIVSALPLVVSVIVAVCVLVAWPAHAVWAVGGSGESTADQVDKATQQCQAAIASKAAVYAKTAAQNLRGRWYVWYESPAKRTIGTIVPGFPKRSRRSGRSKDGAGRRRKPLSGATGTSCGGWPAGASGRPLTLRRAQGERKAVSPDTLPNL